MFGEALSRASGRTLSVLIRLVISLVVPATKKRRERQVDFKFPCEITERRVKRDHENRDHFLLLTEAASGKIIRIEMH